MQTNVTMLLHRQGNMQTNRHSGSVTVSMVSSFCGLWCQTCEGLMGIHCVVKLQIRHVVHAALGFKAPQDGEGFNWDAAHNRGEHGWCTRKLKVFTSHFVFFFYFFIFAQSTRPPPSCFNWLFSQSIRGHCKQSANPPVIITPQPSLTGTGKTWILLHYICMSLATTA